MYVMPRQDLEAAYRKSYASSIYQDSEGGEGTYPQVKGTPVFTYTSCGGCHKMLHHKI